MSRKVPVPLVVVAVLALLSVSAAAALVPEPTLISSEYIEGKGLVPKFEGAEGLEPVPAEGKVVIGDKVYAMSCKLNEDDLLVCEAWLPKSHYGDYADIFLGEFVYQVLIVEPRPQPEPAEAAAPTEAPPEDEEFEFEELG